MTRLLSKFVLPLVGLSRSAPAKSLGNAAICSRRSYRSESMPRKSDGRSEPGSVASVQRGVERRIGPSDSSRIVSVRWASAFVYLTLAVGFIDGQMYFPAGVLARTSEASEVIANQYSRFLKSLHEPSLLELAQQNPKAEVYRFLWLREFDRPASIRFVLKPGGTGWFYRRMTYGTGGGQPGRLAESGMSWSWKSRTASFLNTVAGGGFWNLATLADAAGNATPACRAHWIVEGIKDGRYHVVDRCSPDRSDPARVVGMLAMKLGNLKVRGSHVY
jgi:hypothetical protein